MSGQENVAVAPLLHHDDEQRTSAHSGSSQRHSAELTATVGHREKEDFQQPSATAGFGSVVVPEYVLELSKPLPSYPLSEDLDGIELGLPPLAMVSFGAVFPHWTVMKWLLLCIALVLGSHARDWGGVFD